MNPSHVLVVAGLLSRAMIWATSAAQPEILLENALIARSGGRSGRSVIHVDPIEFQIVSGVWKAPKAGDPVAADQRSDATWQTAKANEQGAITGLRGGYVYWPVVSDQEQVMMLEAAGSSCVYVNDVIRAGDPYGFGYLRYPVLLRKGTNDLLFQSGRGGLRSKLVPSPGPLTIHLSDPTLPDVIEGDTAPLWGAAVLLNATTNFATVSMRVIEFDSPEQVVRIPPLGLYKAPFLFRPPPSIQGNSLPLTLEATALTSTQANARVLANLTLRVRRPSESHVRTFLSEIDGSVQYYAVTPASGRHEPGKHAMVLSLHGAGVEARGQAESYYPKKWTHIVCPTNRRPYGFDWEEWGRLDALEVLRFARNRYEPDPQRIYLTGHSMGGHGTWQIGVWFPDQFAALGPSAGWISFGSYASPRQTGATNAFEEMLLRSAASSETLLMATNYLQQGIYILHGDADDNVPVTQAREMRKFLGEFHRDFDFHEQVGAGHWWGNSDEPGTACVDWPPMFDFFSRHAIPTAESVRRVRFVTVNPAVSSRAQWVTILAQDRILRPSAVDVRCDPGKRRVVGTTTNVLALRFEFPSIKPGGVTIELDGQKLEVKELLVDRSQPIPSVCLRRGEAKWEITDVYGTSLKRPERSGPFREAFRNRMVLVYGTKGSSEENAWTLARARYDADTFYYRGNGAVELMSDAEVIAGKATRQIGQGKLRSRNVIIYGHADCNAAWGKLLGHSPVQVRRGGVRVGNREFSGSDVGCMFLQPNQEDAEALVGVIAGSGLSGMRVTERLPVFLSGAGFPDCLILGADLPLKGVEGVRAAGFFGQDWQAASGEFVWKE